MRAPSSLSRSTVTRYAVRTSGSTAAQPRSDETATRSRDQSTSTSSPSGTGQVIGSAGWAPEMTRRASTRSRTDAPSGPSTDRLGQPRNPGSFGTRPKVGLWPATPQDADGIPDDPPRSVPIASGVAPYATAAPPPPLEPPGVRSSDHGLRVRPETALSVKPR